MLCESETLVDLPPSEQTIEVLKLLGEGLNKSVIARLLHCCWKTVDNIAAGEREAVADGITYYLHGGETFVVKAVKCPTCRGMVHVVPCRLCKERKP